MQHSFKPKGICAREIIFELDDNKLVRNVKFMGGCAGNASGISKLVEGLHVDEVVAKLKGTQCRYGTSCPDQLAKALEEIT